MEVCGTTELIGGTHIVKKKGARANWLLGMVPRVCRAHGLFREKNRTVFCRHTVGIGGVYVYIKRDHFHVKVRELEMDRRTKDQSEVREILEDIDMMEERLALEWKRRIEGYER